MSRRTVRATFPVYKVDKFVALARDIVKKHKELGDDSPLNKSGVIDMQHYEEQLADAESKRERSIELRRESEALMEQSNIILGLDKGQDINTPDTIYYSMGQIRDILLVEHKGYEESLSEWGFNVVINTYMPGRKRKKA